MYELNYKQLEIIKADVYRADISYSHLAYDLIDHICCDIEKEMNLGTPFGKAYEMVKEKIGLHGLQKIQEDTLFLIDKKYRTMKNIMKIFGVISPILISFAALFKIEHWPGAGILLTLGFFLLIVFFLPSAVYVSYREVSNRKKLLAHISGYLSAALFAVSFLFKIQHWPATGIIMLVAVLVTGLIFIPSFFINQLKVCPANQKIAYIFGLIGSIFYLAGFYFKMNHWPGASDLMLCGIFFLIILAFPVIIFSTYKNNYHVTSGFIIISFAIVWFIVPTTLISVNLSGDVRTGLIDNSSEQEYNLQYLTAKCNQLVVKYQTNSISDAYKINEIALQAKKNSDDLVDYVQKIKIQIIGKEIGKNISADHKITSEELEGENGDAINKVLVKEGELVNIYKKISNLDKFLIQQQYIDNNSKIIIDKMLSESKVLSDSADLDKYFESYYLRSPLIVSIIYKLTGIQEKTRSAEYLFLRNLNRKVSSNQALIRTL